MAALLLTVHPAPGSAAKRISSAIRCLDGVGDAGEFFGDGPQSALDVPIVRLCTGSHELRVAAAFEKAAWAEVLAAEPLRVGGCPQRRERPHPPPLDYQYAQSPHRG